MRISSAPYFQGIPSFSILTLNLEDVVPKNLGARSIMLSELKILEEPKSQHDFDTVIQRRRKPLLTVTLEY